MTIIKKYVMWSVLFSALIGLSGCGSSSSDVTTASASDFSMTLDVDESTVSGDWEALSSASGSDTLAASVETQGKYGTFVVTGDTISYRKTTDTNETDTGVLEIGDGADSVQVTVTVHSLFWKQMSEGDSHTSALKSDGTLWSWGMNNDGQLGDGTMEDSTTPVQESTEATDWISISSGGNHSAAIKSDGTIWSWGLNNKGQLGDGTRDNSMEPVQESMFATDWDSVRCGNGYSVAKNKNGKTWRWGRKNTAPVADAQSVITDENTPVLITLSGSDANGDPLTYSIDTGPSNGTLSTISGNKVTYTPSTDYTGADSFTFTVNDGTVDSPSATVSITVNPAVVINTPPVADTQSVITDENVAKLITLSGSDANGDPLTYSIVSGPSNGTLSVVSGDEVTYTPSTDYSGVDSFTFTVNDGTVDSVPATVSITVNNVVTNIAPVADAQSVVTDENIAKLITLSGSDANGDPLTYSIVSGPSNGTLSVVSGDEVTYTPSTDYTGADSFTFTVNDGMVDSAAATVSITVNPAVVVNTPPVADAQSVVTDENVATAITLTGSDADSDPLTYTVVSDPSNGTLTGTAPNLTYTPDADYVGADSFIFKVNDGTEDSALATVSITVDAAIIVNTPPTASDFNMTLDLNESTVIEDWTILSSADDADSDPLTALVKTQGAYGTCVVTDDSLAYLKTIETNATDTCELEISDGTDAVQITVTVNSLYWKQISAGAFHTTALKSDGTLWTWGSNTYGQLGDGTTTNRLVPTQESTGATDWKSVSGGDYHTVALKVDGTLWAWGRNFNGEIGDGTATNRSVPTQESTGATDWSSMNAGGYHTLAIKDDGTLWAWGYNAQGQLGTGMPGLPIPMQESTGATDWSSVSGGGYYSVALKVDGTLWSWGDNRYGQLGDGTTANRSVPTQESTGAINWSLMNAGGWHTVAIKDDGTLWAWGYNEYGGIGDGTTTHRSVPTQEITSAADWNYAEAGTAHTVAIKDNGTLWAWGYNISGQLGDGTTTNRLVPTQESTASTNWSSADGGDVHTVALKSDGTLQANTLSTNSNIVATGALDTVAIESGGTVLLAWGDNSQGQLGDGTTEDRLNPTVSQPRQPAASDAVLAQIGLEADNPDTVASIVTVSQLGDIRPRLTDVNAVYVTAYQDYIDANPDLFSSPAIQAEVQSMVDAVNAGPSNVAPTASDFNLTLDVNESTAIGEWKTLSSADDSDGDTLSASVVTQGNYGNFVVTGDSLTYLKMTETNATDTGVLEISDGTDTVQVTVNLHSLYWKQISAGSSHTVAIKSDGTLWAWGRNIYGELGEGTTTSSLVPIQESTAATDWSSVSAGWSHTVALKSDGTLWAWGLNSNGQLGNGTTINSSVPIQEDTSANDWSSVSAGYSHTTALKSNGTLWAWGDNDRGQLGDGTTTESLVPVQEDTAATDWGSVSAGTDYTVALKSDGTFWAWGDNSYGQLGDGTTIDSLVPVQEDTSANDWSSVSTGYSHTTALKSDGTLWAWGDNGRGQLGDGTTTESLVPVQEDTAATDWSSVSAGGWHTIALKSDGTLWAWGQNRGGRLGDGTTIDSLVPIQESTAATDWSSVSAGGYHTVALKSDGTLWAWGSNSNGQLGDGTTTSSLVPLQESTAATDWSSISVGSDHTVAIKSDGTLWSWGYNVAGQLGDGTKTDSSVPVQESTAATDWISSSAGYEHTVALKSDGTLWGWGDNNRGELGNGTTTDSLVPVQEDTAATDWSSISAGNWHTVALKSDGTLWAWGLNDKGQLGNGTIANSSVPVRENTAATDWISVSAGGNHTIALKLDGTLWAWGDNSSGQLGDGTTTNSLVPIQESTAATDWSSVSAGLRHTIALKLDGALWAWGSNYGKLGDGTTTNSLIPIQEITGATDWSYVSAGYGHTVAIKVDGTLWAWGDNSSGQLGDGTTTNSLVPIQESTAATDWSSVSAGGRHTIALKLDGALWAWGSNYHGETHAWILDPTLSQPRQP